MKSDLMKVRQPRCGNPWPNLLTIVFFATIGIAPRLSAANVPPTLSTVSNQTVNVGQTLSVRLQAIDPDLPSQTLHFSLVQSPSNAALVTVRGSNAVVLWTPSRENADTTNHFKVVVEDNGIPSLSATQSFTVTVTEFAQANFGTMVLQAGQDGCLPVLVDSIKPITNIDLTVVWPPGTLTNFSIQPLAPELCASNVQILSATQALIRLSACAGHSLVLTQATEVADLCFTALEGQTSAVVRLQIPEVVVGRTDGTFVTNSSSSFGRLIVVGAECLLEASFTPTRQRQLFLYGRPGSIYQIDATTNLNTPLIWSLACRVPMTGPALIVCCTDLSTSTVFYRGFRYSEGPTNQAPFVNAGPDQVIHTNATILAGNATDDGLPAACKPLAFLWKEISGPGSVSFNNPTSAVTAVTFSQFGAYVLRLFASDSQDTNSDDVSITWVSDCPIPGPADWTVTVSPPISELGAPAGSVVFTNCEALLTEGNSFVVSLERIFTIPSQPDVLSITYGGPFFDSSASNQMGDAFEAALVDGAGRPLTYTIQGPAAPLPTVLPATSDAFFNHTEGVAPFAAPGTAYLPFTPSAQFSTILCDIRHLAPGTSARLILRLVNNDRDVGTSLRITDVSFKSFDTNLNLIGSTLPAFSNLRGSANFLSLPPECRPTFATMPSPVPKIVTGVSSFVSLPLAQPLLDTNLIANGGAEAGPGSPSGYDIEPVPGWTTTGNFTVAQYGSTFKFPATAPGPPDRGTNLFAGGSNTPLSSASQVIDISAAASLVDGGGISAELSGWLGGGGDNDNAVLTATFLDGSSNTLNQVSIGPVLRAERGFATGLIFEGTTNGVPAGTRQVRLTLIMTRLDPTYDDGYADNLSLILRATRAVAAEVCDSPPSGLISWWRAEGNAVDSAGVSDGTVVNGATFAAGKVGQAFSFDGVNSYVHVSGSYMISGGRTITAWIYPNFNMGLGLPILTGGGSSSYDFFGVAGTTGPCSTTQYELYVDHRGTACFQSSLPVTPRAWSHVAVTWDGNSTITFYINGVAANSVAGSLYNYNIGTYDIGGNNIGGGSTKPSFNGLIDELDLYNRALSASEIAAIYNAGSFGKCATRPPQTVPGIVQAEDFDDGGEGVAYHDIDLLNNGGQYRNTRVDIEATADTSGGYDVGSTAAGEWLNYTINALVDGTYTLFIRVASSGDGGSFHVEFDGVDKTGPLINADSGGGQTWRTMVVNNILLSAGQHIMRLVEDSNGPNGGVGNFNYFILTTTNSLIHRYSFSEDASARTVSDSIGGANGALIGGVAFTGDGKLNFSGTDGYVNLPGGLMSSLTNVTFEFWATWNGGSSYQRIFDFGDNSNGQGNQGTGLTYLALTPSTGGGPRPLLFSATTNSTPEAVRLSWTNPLPVGQQTHVAVACDFANHVAALYVNGQRVSTAPVFIPLSGIKDINDWLGRSNYEGDPALNGQLDEFRIYSGVLSDDAVAASFAAGPNTLPTP